MKNFLFLVVAFFAPAVLVGQKVNDTPVVYQGDPQHSGVYNTTPVKSLKGLKFQFLTGGPIRGTPSIYNGTVFIGSGDGNFYAIDARNGKEQWRFRSEGPINSTPAIFNGVAYFTSRDRTLYAVDSRKGTIVWKYGFKDDLPYRNGYDYYLSSPTIVNGILYVGSGDGFVYSFDVSNGKLNWSFGTGSRVRTSPAVWGDRIFVGTMDGYLYAIDKKEGTLIWRFATLGSTLNIDDFGFDRSALVSSPSVSNGVVTVGCRDGFVYAIDAEHGELKWKYDQNITWPISTPGHYNANVYLGTSDGRFFHSLSLDSGKELWRVDMQAAVWSSPAIAGTAIYVGDLNGFIHCIDITSGEKKWRYKTSGAVYASAIIHDGIVYCGSDDGVLYALEGESTLGTRPPVRKAVFWEKVDGYRWFRNGVDEVVRDYFKREGYEVVDASGLQDMMNAQTDINVRSVVVFADSRVPPEVLVEYGGTTSFRKYLDKGGKVVWLGPCPLAYVRDSTGALETIDYQLPKKILGIQYPGKALDMLGFYGCTLTPEGMQAGLRGWWVGFGSVPSTEVTTVFALDEYGMANSWIKNYGGPEGTGLLQLWIPRDKPIDLIPIKNAVEYGL